MTKLVRWLPRLAAFSLPFLWSVLADARAGGGEHYNPGGSGRSSSGGDDGGIPIWLIWTLVRLTFEYPVIGIPLWAIIIFFAWRMKKARPISSAVHHARHRQDMRQAPPPLPRSVPLGKIAQNDPGFDPDVLAGRVTQLFLEVQEAWFLRDLRPVRRYLTDATFRRLNTLLTLMQAEGRRGAQVDARVIDLRIVAASASESFESVTYAIQASMRDADVRADRTDEQARQEASLAPDRPFIEMWTFVRRKGAKSVDTEVWGQGGCPNCGAPFTGGETNVCEYCKAIVNSGNHDWVLSEITQASEFNPHQVNDRALATLRARDPEAAPEILEDRALLLFWKWIEACAFADPAKVRKLATTAAYERVAKSLEGAPKHRVPLLRTPAVGGADVVSCELDVDGFDRVHVDVRWSAAMNSDGKRPMRHELVMTRKTGAQTDRGAGLSTERCGTCNAPLTDSDSTRCDYCGHDLSSAATEWQLLDVLGR